MTLLIIGSLLMIVSFVIGGFFAVMNLRTPMQTSIPAFMIPIFIIGGICVLVALGHLWK